MIPFPDFGIPTRAEKLSWDLAAFYKGKAERSDSPGLKMSLLQHLYSSLNSNTQLLSQKILVSSTMGSSSNERSVT